MSLAPDNFEQTGPASAVAAGGAVGPDWGNLMPGGRWRGVYQVGEPLPDITHGKYFKAMHVGMIEEVVIRVFRVNDGSRGQVWEVLSKVRGCGAVETIEAVEADGRRAEVCPMAPGRTLRDWLNGRKLPVVEIELVVRQLLRTVGELHAKGIVHLNLHPERIGVVATEAGMQLVVGGLELATLIGRQGMVPVAVDPFYAPPEAAGLYQIEGGAGLRAWDWWSVGRIVQELVLGRHVLGHLLDRDVSRATQELTMRADALLRERDANAMRAGALESMPKMDGAIETLLRGLLTGCRDARWGRRELERWLRKEPVKQRYQLDRNERLFVCDDEAMTVPEAAEHLARTKNGKRAVESIFQADVAGSLIGFVNASDAHRKLAERIGALVKLPEGVAFAAVQPELARELIAGIALAHASGLHAPPVIRGRTVDEAALREWLAPTARLEELGLVRALFARVVSQQIEPLHAETGRWLTELGRHVEAGWKLVSESRLPGCEDPREEARLITVCLSPDKVLVAAGVELKKTYACSREWALDRIFKNEEGGFAGLAVIAWTSADPVRFGYVTHREWAEEQHRNLRARGERLAAAASWLRLARALRAGAPVFGIWARFAVVWGAAGAGCAWVGYFQPKAFVAGGGLVALAVFARFAGGKVHASKLGRFLKSGTPWGIADTDGRCLREARLVIEAERLPGPGALVKSLNEVNAEIDELVGLEPKPEPVARPARFIESWVVGLASWLPLVLLAGVVGWRVFPDIVRLPGLLQSWLPTPPPLRVEKKTHEDEANAAAVVRATEEQVEVGQALEELRKIKAELDALPVPPPKVAWPFKVSAAQKISVQKIFEATPEQAGAAEEMGRLLLERFEAKTIDAKVAVRVPVATGVGLMLYDGATGKLASRKVYGVAFVPLARTWLEFDGQTVFFIGSK